MQQNTIIIGDSGYSWKINPQQKDNKRCDNIDNWKICTQLKHRYKQFDSWNISTQAKKSTITDDIVNNLENYYPAD